MSRLKVQPADQKPVFYLIVVDPNRGPITLVDADRGLHARYGPATLGCAAITARDVTTKVGETSIIYHPKTMELEGFEALSEHKPDRDSLNVPFEVLGAGYGRRDLVSSFPRPSVPLSKKGRFFARSNKRLFVDSDGELADSSGGLAALFAGAVRCVDRDTPVNVRYVDRGEDPAELEAIGVFSEPEDRLDPTAKRGRFKITTVGFV